MEFPILKELKNMNEIIWYNSNYQALADIIDDLPISMEDIMEAENRLQRFAPYIKKSFQKLKMG